jgi:hypothetical protein
VWIIFQPSALASVLTTTVGKLILGGLAARPLDWVGAGLSDLDTLLDRAGMAAADVGTGDAEALRQAVPEIMDALARLLERGKAGQLALAPGDEELTSARIGWL